MALLLVEGFDHFNTQALAALKGWTENNFATLGTFTYVAGRLDGQALSISGGGSSADGGYLKFLPSTYTTVVFGFAVFPANLPSALIGCITDGSGNVILSARLNAAGHVEIVNSTLGSVHATGTATFVTGAWFYVELKATINGASGSISTQVNGVADIAPTTVNWGTAPIGGVQIRQIHSSAAAFDDIYVCDTSGTENNDFLGDVHVETLLPVNDGADTDWVPDSGSSHYVRVNENPPDEDSSFVADHTVSDTDTYIYPSLSVLTDTIFGVQTNLWARKDNASTRAVQSVIRRAGTDYASGIDKVLSTSYVDETDIYEHDPSTSAQWTVSGVNNAQFGIKVSV